MRPIPKIGFLLLALLLSSCDLEKPEVEAVKEPTSPIPYSQFKCNHEMLMQKDGNGFWYYPKGTDSKGWIRCR